MDETKLSIVDFVKKKTGYQITTSLGQKEIFNSETLNSDKLGHIYCELNGSETPVIFHSTATEQLHKFCKVSDGFWGISINGLFYPFMTAEQRKLTEKKLPKDISMPVRSLPKFFKFAKKVERKKVKSVSKKPYGPKKVGKSSVKKKVKPIKKKVQARKSKIGRRKKH